MKPYLISLVIGLLVGGAYALMRVRSPAPPVIALVGLLGMLIGEQGIGLALSLLPNSTKAVEASPSTTYPATRSTEKKNAR